MSEAQPALHHRRLWVWLAPVAILASVGVVLLLVSTPRATTHLAVMPPEPPEAASEDVHRVCGACHAYPPPDLFPRFAWRKEVKQGYDFLHQDPRIRVDFPSLDSVVRYYENRAPEQLPVRSGAPSNRTPPMQFERRVHAGPPGNGPPGIAHITTAHLFHKDKLDILVCDALNEQVAVLCLDESPPRWRILANGLCCAHAEVVDLDGDGINDVVVACLGNFYATDDRVGSVVWLRGSADGSFTPITLLDGVGRVADVRVADFTGDGKLDLVVAVFGWRQTGEILLLENQTTDWSRPVFARHVLDQRHGTTHVPVADLNRDGKPDFVALISQEHETVVAFLNEGNGKFRKETIWNAPHPAFGCNGIQLADLDGDGDLDVVLTNGDALDAPYVLKPYHGVQWLENRGTFPFTHHRLSDEYGAGSPVAVDIDGDGDLDIVVVSFLPAEYFPQRAAFRLASVVLFEQTSPGRFVRHELETVTCDHLACAVARIDGNAQPAVIVGHFAKEGGRAAALTIWQGRKSESARP